MAHTHWGVPHSNVKQSARSLRTDIKRPANTLRRKSQNSNYNKVPFSLKAKSPTQNFGLFFINNKYVNHRKGLEGHW